jgi:hypothetical protein
VLGEFRLVAADLFDVGKERIEGLESDAFGIRRKGVQA